MLQKLFLKNMKETVDFITKSYLLKKVSENIERIEPTHTSQ